MKHTDTDDKEPDRLERIKSHVNEWNDLGPQDAQWLIAEVERLRDPETAPFGKRLDWQIKKCFDLQETIDQLRAQVSEQQQEIDGLSENYALLNKEAVRLEKQVADYEAALESMDEPVAEQIAREVLQKWKGKP